jgi:hypothetical protein
MTYETVQVRYGIGDLVPRMVVGFIAANFATPICSNLIQTANALTAALTGDAITAAGSFEQMRQVVTGALTNASDSFLLVVVGMIIAVLTGILLVYWLVRTGVLIILVGIAPVALACHATPFTDGAARLWWRSLLGVLATVTLQAFAMHTALSIFLDPGANLPALGIPRDPSGTLNLFIVACPAVGHREDPRDGAPLRDARRPAEQCWTVSADAAYPAGVPPGSAPARPRPYHRRPRCRWRRRATGRSRRRGRRTVGGQHRRSVSYPCIPRKLVCRPMFVTTLRLDEHGRTVLGLDALPALLRRGEPSGGSRLAESTAVV